MSVTEGAVSSASSPSPPSSVKSPAPEPILGVFYHVQRTDKTWHVAEVIQKRENPESKKLEYYVHYKECESENHRTWPNYYRLCP